ncbi:FtsW/RodA/SpoVE family cell cycle protein [Clostridiaceae bacterium NSJ-31]|uniref:FtsW/RodA/SpoVE family cell cycle protein n=1 Tax=Ligaoa zhengdingensis TaxID=2763658 RepID=A0A926I0X4_9FIRM|nr:FtsW/RodA/SpoVE family cell cycle protein [Ligaoa zhengdingensis]MBC8547472.1 FtsW/RodA/SpoVE family cell cycle protein [Ligaoa zhengdingensis]
MKKVIHAIGNYFRTTDYWLLLLCITCSGISVVLLFGIYRNEYIGDGKIFTQAAAILMGLMAAVILSKIDYRFIAKMWKLHVPLALFLVILTFFIGKQVSETVDDKAWLEIFGFNLQPSEFLKISFIMSFAYHLSLVKEHLNAPKNVLLLCLHGAVPVLLIHFQGDDGSALIFALIFVVMLFSAGLSWKYLVTALVGAAIAIPVVWFGVMNYDQKMRFLAIFHPDDPEFATIFYQQYHGNISIGTGGVWGKGILTDKLRYVPEMHNDFIFSVAGEMLGFVGCIAIIGLLAAICLKILHNYRRCPDALGQNICVGVFAMYASQIIINIGMNLSVVPVIGVTLPFLSAGGSSILSTYMGIGLVLSVYLYNTKGLFTDNIS